MIKRGWYSLKGMIIIFIIGLVIINTVGFYFGNIFTGSAIVGAGGRISIDVNQKMYIDGKLLELRLISPNSAKVIVNGVEGLINKDNVKIINGLQIKVLETTDLEGDVSDSAVLFVKKFESDILDVEDGKYELNYNKNIVINGHVVSIFSVSFDSVLFKVDDVNKQLSVGETSNIDGLVITLKDVNNFIGDEFDSVIFFAAEGSGKLDCWGCDRFDLAYSDSVRIYDKELSFMGVNDEGFMKFIVNSKTGILLLKDDTDINGLQLYVESFKNDNDVYLDRVNVLVKEVEF